jgi:hypothetical protein
MLASLLCLLIELKFFPLFFYMPESPRLTPFTLHLNEAIFYSFSLSDHQRIKPVSQDTQLWTLGEPRPAVTHSHGALNIPLKSGHFL